VKRDEQKDLKTLADAFFAELFVSDVEYGGIGLDPKRPFGNRSVEHDMLELLDAEPEGDDGEDECFSSEQREYVRDLYHNKLIPYLRSRWQELNS
jgi:hypothetical protein